MINSSVSWSFCSTIRRGSRHAQSCVPNTLLVPNIKEWMTGRPSVFNLLLIRRPFCIISFDIYLLSTEIKWRFWIVAAKRELYFFLYAWNSTVHVATYLIKQVCKPFLWDVSAIVIGPWAMGKPIRCCFSSEPSPSITVPRPRPFRSAAFPHALFT